MYMYVYTYEILSFLSHWGCCVWGNGIVVCLYVRVCLLSFFFSNIFSCALWCSIQVIVHVHVHNTCTCTRAKISVCNRCINFFCFSFQRKPIQQLTAVPSEKRLLALVDGSLHLMNMSSLELYSSSQRISKVYEIRYDLSLSDIVSLSFSLFLDKSWMLSLFSHSLTQSLSRSFAHSLTHSLTSRSLFLSLFHWSPCSCSVTVLMRVNLNCPLLLLLKWVIEFPNW